MLTGLRGRYEPLYPNHSTVAKAILCTIFYTEAQRQTTTAYFLRVFMVTIPSKTTTEILAGVPGLLPRHSRDLACSLHEILSSESLVGLLSYYLPRSWLIDWKNVLFAAVLSCGPSRPPLELIVRRSSKCKCGQFQPYWEGRFYRRIHVETQSGFLQMLIAITPSFGIAAVSCLGSMYPLNKSLQRKSY